MNSTDPQVIAPLRLEVHWEPFWPSFLTNLSDVIFRREAAPITVTSRPGVFWPDVFVNRPIPWKEFGQSVLFHVAMIAFVLSTGQFWLLKRPSLEDTYKHTDITYYDISEYLPPMKSASPAPKAKEGRKGSPEYSKQEIVSAPPNPDNSTQTIINPPHPNIIRKELPLPNMVVFANTPVVPPVVSVSPTAITLPNINPMVVQPKPDLSQLKNEKKNLPVAEVIEPAPDPDAIKKTKPDLALIDAKVDPIAPAPELALPLRSTQLAQVNAPEVAAPAPSGASAALKSNKPAAGQLMALNLRPSAPKETIEIPDGSRAGAFASSPTGTPGAAGVPKVRAAGDSDSRGNGGSNNSASTGGSGSGAGVGAGSPNGTSGISISGGSPNSGSAGAVAARPTFPPRPAVVANASPSPFDVSRKPIPAYTPTDERKIEDQIFGKKKYYSMQLNMPNLTSSGGSWIIRFAELKDSKDPSEISTPVATRKVDPAYPPDLIKDHVEGTVTLYAVIHADGSVGEVRLLQGIHEQLDENARIALLRWHFQPALKNGVPVDLEAVFQVPYKIPKGRIY